MSALGKVLFRLIILLAVEVPAWADWPTGVWLAVASTNAPALAHHDMAYDSARGQLVMVGTDITVWPRTNWFVFFGDSNLTWTAGGELPDGTGADPEVAYDAGRGVTVVYTGTNIVWEYDGSTWSRIAAATMPVQCPDGALMEYDPVRGRVVLVGAAGLPATNAASETWLWDGADWTLAADAAHSPTGAAGGAMAFDAARGEMVLLTMTDMQTWTFDGTNWTQRAPATRPAPGVWVTQMAYEPNSKLLIQYGGEAGIWPSNTYPAHTWAWNGGDWHLLNGATNPGGNIDYALAFFPPQNSLIMHGGWCDPYWQPRTNVWRLARQDGPPPPSLIVNHADIPGLTNVPAAVMAKVGQLRWFFSHASVGGNMITGMFDLNDGDAARYPLAVYNYDGGVATAGAEGGADYRAAADPTVTSNGVIYDCMRGNPNWDNKLTCFSNSLVVSGWRFPKVNVAMDKYCWIDPYADPTNTYQVMADLEGRFPETLIVYTTMPLTDETSGENDLRNDFNRVIRAYCAANGKVLYDVADIESWSTNGSPNTYVSGGVTNQMIWSGYAETPGGDYHLNAVGRRQVALGWYALAAALFRTDRDGDGIADGDELLAGTCPTNAASVYEIRSIASATAGAGRFVLTWPTASNRLYSLAWSPRLTNAAWVTLLTNAPATVNSFTTPVQAAGAAIFRGGVKQ